MAGGARGAAGVGDPPHDEAVFFVNRDGERHDIDLTVEVSVGRIQEVSVDAQGIAETAQRLSPEFRERLDAGELEAIAYLVTTAETDLHFVSGDGPAIQAVPMIHTDTRVMSLQEVLDRCGWSKPVASQYRREFVEKHRREGSTRRIQGKGLGWTSGAAKAIWESFSRTPELAALSEAVPCPHRSSSKG